MLEYLADERRQYSAVLWVNLQDELVLECNGQIFSPREPACPERHVSLHAASAQQIEVTLYDQGHSKVKWLHLTLVRLWLSSGFQKLELALKDELTASQKWLEVTLEQEKQMKMMKSCRTVQEIFSSHAQTRQRLQYTRIPLPECAAPTEEVRLHPLPLH